MCLKKSPYHSLGKGRIEIEDTMTLARWVPQWMFRFNSIELNISFQITLRVSKYLISLGSLITDRLQISLLLLSEFKWINFYSP